MRSRSSRLCGLDPCHQRVDRMLGIPEQNVGCRRARTRLARRKPGGGNGVACRDTNPGPCQTHKRRWSAAQRHDLPGQPYRLEVAMVGALLLGFVAGAVARALMPNDVFRGMSGPKSWLVSTIVGLIGALVGYFIFTVLLGIGDTDIFDWGGIVGAILGTLLVLPVAGWVLRRLGSKTSA